MIPTARVGLEENGKESSGTPGGGPTIQTPMGLGLGLPLTAQASGPRPDRKITAFYSHIKKRQGVGEKAEADWTWVDASAGEHRGSCLVDHWNLGP
jgi:hypothetical protein